MPPVSCSDSLVHGSQATPFVERLIPMAHIVMIRNAFRNGFNQFECTDEVHAMFLEIARSAFDRKFEDHPQNPNHADYQYQGPASEPFGV